MQESLPLVFAHLTPGVAKRKEVSYRGLKWYGEVLLSNRWLPNLGEKIESDIHFRIVILSRPQVIPPSALEDQRIALCVPLVLPSLQERRALTDQLSKLRETRANYLTRQESGAAAMQDPLREQEAQLWGERLSATPWDSSSPIPLCR